MNRAKVKENAWKVLNDSIVEYRGKPIGTLAAMDPTTEALNYNQVFTRDFAVSALAFLAEGKTEIVRNFLLQLVELQSREKHFDCFRAARGLMPASFEVKEENGKESIVPDFGEKAIARVFPVDAVFWWLFLLRAYVCSTGENLHERPQVQESIRLILDLSLTPRFDMFPTLLVPDGSFMIDRRMGVYGHPLDIQALFYAALRASYELLLDNEKNAAYIHGTRERLGHLTYHIRYYYWMDFRGLNNLYRSNVEEYGLNALNRFNIYSDSIPEWLHEWFPPEGGYFIGNLGPARMDFRFFTAGNLMAVLSSLADESQATSILELIRSNKETLIGHMPIKVTYPALEGERWSTLTGSDPKNTPWSYQNAGGWPFLLWLLAAAEAKTGASELTEEAMRIAETRISTDTWPEYYDGPRNRLVGKEAKLNQVWSAAGYIIADRILEDPGLVDLFGFKESADVIACSTRIARTFEGGEEI